MKRLFILFTAAFLVGCSAGKRSVPTQPTPPAPAVQMQTGTQTPDQPPVPPAPFHLYSLHMMSEYSGWALASEGVLRTSDGGVTWTNASPSGLAHDDHHDLFFLNDQTACVLAPQSTTNDAGLLYQTVDGGHNWMQVYRGQ